jgi:hypothetical protein
MGTITSANSQFVISIPDVFPVDLVLQGYAVDDAFTNDAVELTERRMGVDGTLSAGYTPNPKPIHVALQPDSPSVPIFDAWKSAMESAQEAYSCTVIIAMPSIGKQYICNVGWLGGVNILPDARKVLDPQHFVIEFQSVQAAPL